MTKPLDVSPMKSALEELDLLRVRCRECLQAYTARLESGIDTLHRKVLLQANAPKTSTAQLKDLRDLLTLCRTFDFDPSKGRRKDLKRLESLIQELEGLLKDWQTSDGSAR